MFPSMGPHPKVQAVINEFGSGGPGGSSSRFAGSIPASGSQLPKAISASGRPAALAHSDRASQDPPFVDRGNPLLQKRGKLKANVDLNASVKRYIMQMRSPTGD